MTHVRFTRRSVLRSAVATGALASFGLSRAARAQDDNPRFLLQVLVQGGVDHTMLFDARPLAMTAGGLVHNTLGEEPTVWAGNNGGQALAASTTAPLLAVRDLFTVVNGVMMAPTFDGHEQNLNLLLTGNPFGGGSLLADLNLSGQRALDYLKLGAVGGEITDSRFVSVTPSAVNDLATQIGQLGGLSPSLDAYLQERCSKIGNGHGRFSVGARALGEAMQKGSALAEQLGQISVADVDEPVLGALGLVAEFFRRRLASGAVLSLSDDLSFDNHDPTETSQQGPTYQTLCERLATMFAYLRDTPFDEQRSLLDVTTVVVASEFGRTMRQDRPIDATGTDHNNLSATLLVGGAGIQCGNVIGQSDFQSVDEELSGSHLSLDGGGYKTMGRPFDFDTGLVRTDAPEEFSVSDHLMVGSVVNTLYSLFGVEQSVWRTLERNGPPAPIVSQLLKA